MRKIYFGTKPLFIAREPNEDIAPFLDAKGAIVLRQPKESEIANLVRQIQQEGTIAGVILGEEEGAFSSLKKHFQLIQAAGGLVFTSSEEILMIYRRGKWDLPKGKLDEGEDLENCAVREVEEETGLQNIVLKGKIGITYHTYHQGADHVLKESHWYLMQTESNQVFTPQTDEDIEKCEWVKLNSINPYLENTHPSILDVVKEGLPLVKRK